MQLDHCQRAYCHGSSCIYWIQQCRRCNWNHHYVVDERPKQVRVDLQHSSLAKFHCQRDVSKVIFDEHDAACFLGDISSTSDSNADICLRKRGGVVNSIAYHRYHFAFALELLDSLFFLPWQHVRYYMLNV